MKAHITPADIRTGRAVLVTEAGWTRAEWVTGGRDG